MIVWLTAPWSDHNAAAFRHRVVGNGLPAAFFALLLLARARGLAEESLERVMSWGAAELLRLANDAAGFAFQSLIVGLIVFRLPVRGNRSDPHGMAVALLGTFLLNAIWMVPRQFDPPEAVVAVGTLSILGGTLFATWSLATLGRCFGLFPEARGGIQKGPYRWMRHPVYVGEIVAGLGVVLGRPSLIGGLVFGGFVALQAWRAALEERALLAALPEYAEMQRTTHGLIPGLPWQHRSS